MNSQDFNEFNRQRTDKYHKDQSEEDFLTGFNRYLRERERQLYGDYPITHPFLFVFGPPRSGTTLLTQLIAHGLDVGYINNLMARFWMAPVHGIRFSKAVLDSHSEISFQSDYAHTENLGDIHEFGYFWRNLLQIHSMDDIVHVKEQEEAIDWGDVRTVLANILQEFGKPMVFKNIYGAYYLQRLQQELGPVIGICIERDELDDAVSILRAREEYYGDPNVWWSYTPPEYDQLKDLDYHRQIAGQIHYLKRFYEQEIARMGTERVAVIQYEDLCRNPGGVLEKIIAIADEVYNFHLERAVDVPEQFTFRTYTDQEAEKRKFKQAFESIRKGE